MPDVTEIFSFGMEQRLQCKECNKVRYRVDGMDTISISVPAIPALVTGDAMAVDTETSKQDKKFQPVQLIDCVDSLLETEPLEYSCPSCRKAVLAERYMGQLP